MQQPPPTPPAPNPRALGDQIREAVERSVEAARAQAAANAGGREAAMDQAIDEAVDAAVDASPQLTPTVVVRRGEFDQLPPQVVDITLMFFLTVFAIIVGFPIARAFARWIDRRGQQPRLPTDVGTQLNQLAQSVDAMAIEIERISEGQRFTTRLLSEQQGRKGLAPAAGEVPPFN